MPLRGIKVIEFGGLAPAPFCGMVLADFGATVIRVDRVTKSVRHAEPLDPLGNGKKSIAVNLKDPKGVQIIQNLCKTCDVVLEPFRKGVMESINLGPNILLKNNPKLIYARLTGFGQNGYYADRAGHDINYVAISGLLSLFKKPADKPFPPVNLAADFGGGGLMCSLGILLALFERSKSGLGQVIDANMVEGSSYLGSWLYRSQSLPIWGQPAGDNILDGGAHFYSTYKTKDGKYLAVGALEPQFYKILLTKLELEEDEMEQYSDFEKKKEILTKIFLEKTQNEWCEIFDKTDACVTPVLSLDEAPKHVHNLQKKSFYTNESDIHCPKPAPTLSRTPGVSVASEQSPTLGEHTIEILKSLSYSDADIKMFKGEGVIDTADRKAKL